MGSVFKKFTAQDKAIVPFNAHKQYDYVSESAALNSGALGCSISGSGPSIFALSQGIGRAEAVEESMKKVYNETEIEFSTYVSKINDKGVKII